MPLPSSIFSPKMLPKGDPKHPKTLPERPKSYPRALLEGPRELSGALLEVPNRSQELHMPQNVPPGAQKTPPRGLWAVIWRLFCKLIDSHLAAIRLNLALTSLLLQSLPPLDKIGKILADQAAIR